MFLKPTLVLNAYNTNGIPKITNTTTLYIQFPKPVNHKPTFSLFYKNIIKKINQSETEIKLNITKKLKNTDTEHKTKVKKKQNKK